jgi:hypothetical protein
MRLCAGFDARLFFSLRFEKETGEKKHRALLRKFQNRLACARLNRLMRFFMKHARKLAKAELQK